jgi:hypothetical protein
MRFGLFHAFAIEIEVNDDRDLRKGGAYGVPVAMRYVLNGHYMNDHRESWEYSTHMLDVLSRLRKSSANTSLAAAWEADRRSVVAFAAHKLYGLGQPDSIVSARLSALPWEDGVFVPNGFECFDIGFCLVLSRVDFCRVVGVSCNAASKVLDDGNIDAADVSEIVISRDELNSVIDAAETFLQNVGGH